MLIIAPLRVCQTVWRQEAQKWEQFRHLRFSLLHGDKKADRLKDDADVWLINPEGVQWLAKMFFGRALPWDTVVIDELTKFKNHSAERSKSLRPRLKQVARRWGLTGSPAPNGLMDLFGQMLILDDGAALGRFITHYRDTYFQLDYDGFTYSPMPGAQKRIEARVAPYVLTMSADDYLTLPPLVDDVRLLEMEPSARKTYSKMKKDMLAELPEGVVTGANAAAVYNKLSQMANGAVYIGPDKSVSVIHDTKLDALDDLLEELAGQQLLLAYEFQHDCDRLAAHYGDRLVTLSHKSEAKTAEIVRDWNAGKIQLLACHPASAAHGLNLQESSAAHVAWFSPTWDLELYMQFIRRIRRQGNEALRIFNHLFVMRDSIDELKLQATVDKDVTQTRFLNGLNSILRDADTRAAGQAVKQESAMVKLSRGNDAAPQTRSAFSGQPAATGGGQTVAAPAQERVLPPGWGGQTAAAANNGQAGRIEERLRGQPADAEAAPGQVIDAKSAFSGGVQATHAALAGGQVAADPAAGDTAEAPRTRTRRSSAKAAETSDSVDNSDVNERASLRQIRLELVKIAFAGPDMELKDGLEVAKELFKFVNGE